MQVGRAARHVQLRAISVIESTGAHPCRRWGRRSFSRIIECTTKDRRQRGRSDGSSIRIVLAKFRCKSLSPATPDFIVSIRRATKPVIRETQKKEKQETATESIKKTTRGKISVYCLRIFARISCRTGKNRDVYRTLGKSAEENREGWTETATRRQRSQTR